MSGGAPPASGKNTGPGTSVTDRSSASPAAGGSGLTPGTLGMRPPKKPVVGGKVPHHDLICGRRYIPCDQTMAAKLARENRRMQAKHCK